MMMQHNEDILPRNKVHDCYCGGVVNWRVATVHYVAKLVGLHVKLEGMPLGTARNLERPSAKSMTNMVSGQCASQP